MLTGTDIRIEDETILEPTGAVYDHKHVYMSPGGEEDPGIVAVYDDGSWVAYQHSITGDILDFGNTFSSLTKRFPNIIK